MLTYILFKTQSMLLSGTRRKAQPDANSHTVQNQSTFLSATSRRGQPDADLHPVQNPEHALVRNKEEGPARCQLTNYSKPEHVLVSNKQEWLARCWLTSCSKPRTVSCQKQAERVSKMLTYTLLKIQSMLLSATSRRGQPDADLHPVQNPEHAFVSNKQEWPSRCWLTVCSKPRSSSCQQQAGTTGWMLTYMLFKTQSMLFSAKNRKGQPDADLQTVQNPEHALVRNKQEGPVRSWLTLCLKPRACSCQQQAGRVSQMLTYNLFKTQSMLLSRTTKKGQPDADVHPVQNPEPALVSNK